MLGTCDGTCSKSTTVNMGALRHRETVRKALLKTEAERRNEQETRGRPRSIADEKARAVECSLPFSSLHQYHCRSIPCPSIVDYWSVGASCRILFSESRLRSR